MRYSKNKAAFIWLYGEDLTDLVVNTYNPFCKHSLWKKLTCPTFGKSVDWHFLYEYQLGPG
jgi:hypothetical protein